MTARFLDFLFRFLINLIVFAALSVGTDLQSQTSEEDSTQAYLVRPDQVSLHGDIESLKEYLQQHPEAIAHIKKHARLELVVDKKLLKNAAYISEAKDRLSQKLLDLGLNPKSIQIKAIEVNYESVFEEVGRRFSEAVASNKDINEFDDENREAQDKETSLGENENAEKKLVFGFSRMLVHWYHSGTTAFERIKRNPFRTTLIDAPKCAAKCVVGILSKIGHEAAYLGGVYKRSLMVPDIGSAGIAVLTRIPSAFTSTIETVSAFIKVGASNISLGIHVFTGLGLNFGHGIITPIWVNAQRTMVKERGVRYQMLFDFGYGQFWSFFFRTNAYIAGLPGTSPDLNFFATSMGTALVGSAFGGLGYEGMTDLIHKKGMAIFTANTIQILRDTLFTVSMNRLGIGDLNGFILSFAATQGVSLGLYIGGKFVRYDEKIVFADKSITMSKEFANAYPEAVSMEKLEDSEMRKFIGNAKSLLCNLIWK